MSVTHVVSERVGTMAAWSTISMYALSLSLLPFHTVSLLFGKGTLTENLHAVFVFFSFFSFSFIKEKGLVLASFVSMLSTAWWDYIPVLSWFVRSCGCPVLTDCADVLLYQTVRMSCFIKSCGCLAVPYRVDVLLYLIVWMSCFIRFLAVSDRVDVLLY